MKLVKRISPTFLSLPTLLMLLVVLISYTSCKNDAVSDGPNPEDQEILNYLAQEGFNIDEVKILDDFVDYEEDAGWDKADLLRTIRGENPEEFIPVDPDDLSIVALDSEERQQGIRESNRTDAITKGRVDGLKYFIRPSVQSDCGTAWVNAIDDAADEWNALSNCRVSLTKASSQFGADIVWGSDLDSGLISSHQNLSAIAKAGFPSSGKAWKWISINDNQDAWGSKLKTAMHEFGHCLGYRHTGTSDGQFIHGTPTTESGSIMLQGSNTSPSFQTGDRRAARVYYPESYTTPNSVSVTRASAGTVRITYRNSNFISRPYYWIRVYKYNSLGIYVSHVDIQSRTSNSTGFHTFTWSGHTSGRNYKFAVRGYNFRKDINSSRTSKFSVGL